MQTNLAKKGLAPKGAPSLITRLRRCALPGWFAFLLPAAAATAALLCGEWIHRGSLDGTFWQDSLAVHLPAYLLAWLLLLGVYCLVDGLAKLPALAVVCTGAVGCIPAAVTYFKLKLRGEPLFPWDFSQLGEALQVAGKSGVQLQPSMVGSALIFLALAAAACFVRRPHWGWKTRAVRVWAPAAGLLVLVFGVYLQPGVTLALKIYPDMWMQNRYYRTYGVISGFMTNLQALNIAEPEGYSPEAVQALADQADETRAKPRYAQSYRAAGDGTVRQPSIIFVMDESFWDASELPGVTYSEELTPNLHRLAETSAYGRAYSPSFGGGTCDVEFEALTGFSVEFLPGGCKPFQQHVTHDMFALPNYLKDQGYQTAAVHGYYKRFWSRNTAYPHLGIDKFIGLEDMQSPEKKRGVYWKGGLVTDAEMARQIIDAYEEREPGRPIFLHAVTMQNHTTYNKDNYPAGELVDILEAPAGMSAQTRDALRDFATGVRDADAMLGTLTDYFAAAEEPVILVFWGDHYNPIGSGYEVYTSTGYASADSQDPRLHGMPLLIWSNYWQGKTELGTIGTYEIAPVMMELYGLETPPFFEYLLQQLDVYRSRTLGVTVLPDGTAQEAELTEEQQAWFNGHWMMQYDMMFGDETLWKPEEEQP